VVGIEPDPALARQASANLAELGLPNAIVREGKLDRGYAERAPYDLILLSGAVEEIPPALIEQLADGGRLVGVVHPQPGLGAAMLIARSHGAVSRRVVFDAATPLLPGLRRQPSFVF
jgi:protein-L-isoaspartate(D-aspartate) O-methyltransferase